MNRRKSSRLALCLCLAMAGTTVSTPAAASECYQGTIELVRSEQLTLLVRGQRKIFHVPRNVVIFLNGMEATLEDLNAGQFARIDGREQGGKLVAKMITAEFNR